MRSCLGLGAGARSDEGCMVGGISVELAPTGHEKQCGFNQRDAVRSAVLRHAVKESGATSCHNISKQSTSVVLRHYGGTIVIRKGNVETHVGKPMATQNPLIMPRWRGGRRAG